MTEHSEQPRDLDARIAANVRMYRSRAGMSQQELADAMTYAGVPWSKRIVWAVEAEDPKVRRPLRVAEAETLGTILDHESDMPVEMFLHSPAVRGLRWHLQRHSPVVRKALSTVNEALNAAHNFAEELGRVEKERLSAMDAARKREARSELEQHNIVRALGQLLDRDQGGVPDEVRQAVIDSLDNYARAAGFEVSDDAEA